MRSSWLAPLLAGVAHALPQAASSCVTVTSAVTVPTTTATYTTTAVTTVLETTAQDLGTFTQVTTISSTTTLQTLTSTTTECTASGTITRGPTSTVYTTASADPASLSKRSRLELYGRDGSACTVTVPVTTTVGETATVSVTSTYQKYTSFTMATVTETKSNGKAYAIATATATTSGVCGPTVNATAPTSTVTVDARCAPSALTSAYNGYGLEYADHVVGGGARYTTPTDDASQCCQQCADADQCAASVWDIRTNQCILEFPVSFSSGELSCGEGALVFYGAGPLHPKAPGSGLYVQALCGDVHFASAPPDDGS